MIKPQPHTQVKYERLLTELTHHAQEMGKLCAQLGDVLRDNPGLLTKNMILFNDTLDFLIQDVQHMRNHINQGAKGWLK